MKLLKTIPILKLIVLILVIVGLGFFGVYKILPAFSGKVATKSDYSAIFLDNNQVYFGKIGRTGGDFVKVTDVYYFESPSASSAQVGSDITLVKLGSEVHGPTDEMKINRDHILYLEELTDDSRVVAAIRSYKNQE